MSITKGKSDELTALKSTIRAIYDECDGYADCDDGPEGIANRPNLAMRIQMKIGNLGLDTITSINSHEDDATAAQSMTGEQFTDAQIATAVRMLMRDQLDHEMVCVMARDRITSLSERVLKAETELNQHVGKQALKAWVNQSIDTANERDDLRKTVAGLRSALESLMSAKWDQRFGNGLSECYAKAVVGEIKAALNASPEEHVNRIKAEVLNEWALKFSDCESNHSQLLMDEVNRLESVPTT